MVKEFGQYLVILIVNRTIILLVAVRYLTEKNRRSEYDIVGLNSVKYSLVNVTLHRLYTLLLIHIAPVQEKMKTTILSNVTTTTATYLFKGLPTQKYRNTL